MKSVKSKVLFGMMMVLVCLFVVGCVTGEDPETGKKLLSLDPNDIANLQRMGEAGSMVLGVLGVFWPGLLAVATYIGGAVRISRKLTPKLIEAQVESEMYHTIASSTVLGIAEFAKEFPTEFEKLGVKLDELKDKIIKPEDQLRFENVIRGLRGLPPKV